MKKLILTLCFVLLFTVLPVNVFGALPSVVDGADVLTDTEEESLSEYASEFRTRGYDIVILTMDGSYGGKGVAAYADDYFDYNGYGVGSRRSGVLFLVNLTERDLYISTSGEAISALTDIGIEMLLDTLTPHFSDAQYYNGFKLLYSELDYYITEYENGTPVGAVTGEDHAFAAVICLVIGFVISLLIMLGIKGGMKTARLSRDAVYAINRDSFNLSRQRDVFLYSRTRRIPRSDSSSSGGSSTHRSSSGRSHGGGGRKF